MTSKITDLEGRIDAAIARANKAAPWDRALADLKRNKKLYAAAPDLFQAAVRLLENLDENGRGHGNPEADALRAAIQKVEGR